MRNIVTLIEHPNYAGSDGVNFEAAAKPLAGQDG